MRSTFRFFFVASVLVFLFCIIRDHNNQERMLFQTNRKETKGIEKLELDKILLFVFELKMKRPFV